MIWIITTFAVAAASYTIARAGVFEATRQWAGKVSPKLEELFRCPYCIAHWLAFLAAGFIQKPFVEGTGIFGLIVTVFAVVCGASILHLVMLRAYTPIMGEKGRIIQITGQMRDEAALIADEAWRPDIAEKIRELNVS